MREDPAAREIFDFLVDLPQDDFKLYGQYLKDIYCSKIQEESNASKVLKDRETSELRLKIEGYVKKNEELANQVSQKEQLITNLKIEAAKERKMKDMEIREKIAQAKVSQEKEIAMLNHELERNNKMNEVTVQKKTNEEVAKQESKWNKKIEERDNKINQLQREKDDLQTKMEEHFVNDNRSMTQSNEKILSVVQEIEKVMIKPQKSSHIGKRGEEFVLQALKEAFPNNKRILLTKQNQCGDIRLNIENTNKWIMFEV